MRIPDDVLLRIYRRNGKTPMEALDMLIHIRENPSQVDPGLTPPCIDNAADDSYFANHK